jgi:hypothetical protein
MDEAMAPLIIEHVWNTADRRQGYRQVGLTETPATLFPRAGESCA